MIANTENAVKPKHRYGRHPLDVVKRMVQAKLGRNQMALYLALGEHLINNSNTTINLDDDRLAEATGLDLRQVADARRAFTVKDGGTEFVQVRPAVTKYNKRIVGTYTYRLLEAEELETEILEPDFSVPNVDQKVKKSVTESQETGNEISGNREQKVKKSVNQFGANPRPVRESQQSSNYYTNYYTNYTTNYPDGGELVEEIGNQWKKSRGKTARPEHLEQLLQYCQDGRPKMEDQELLDILAEAFSHQDHLEGNTPLWFVANRGSHLIDELLGRKQGQAAQQRQRAKMEQVLDGMTQPSPSDDDGSQQALEIGRQFVHRWTEFGDQAPAQRMARFFRRLPSDLMRECGLDRARLNKILSQGLTEADFPTLRQTETAGNITVDVQEGTQTVGDLMAGILRGRHE
jgi:hypothetical protein